LVIVPNKLDVFYRCKSRFPSRRALYGDEMSYDFLELANHMNNDLLEATEARGSGWLLSLLRWFIPKRIFSPTGFKAVDTALLRIDLTPHALDSLVGREIGVLAVRRSRQRHSPSHADAPLAQSQIQ
jgi:hypothetical protein